MKIEEEKPIEREEKFSVNVQDCELMEVNKTEKSATWKAVPTEITIDGRAVFVPGVDIEEYNERKTILWNHWEDIQVGSAMWAKLIQNGNKPYVLVKGKFMNTDFAQEVWEGVRDDWYRFVSPGLVSLEAFYDRDANGAYEKDYGKKPKADLWYYGRKTKMYELSIAPVPAWSGAVKQKMHLMSDKMKKTLAFDLLENYISKVDSLESKISSIAETLEGFAAKAGDGEKPLGQPAKLFGDVSIDEKKLNSVIDNIFRSTTNEKSKES